MEMTEKSPILPSEPLHDGQWPWWMNYLRFPRTFEESKIKKKKKVFNVKPIIQ